MCSKNCLRALLVMTILLHQGCAVFGPPVKVMYGKDDKCGCRVPPEDVFITTGVDLKIAQSTISKIVVNGIDYKTDPKVVTIASQAMIDERIRDYLRCSQIKREGYSPEQVNYYRQMEYILSTKPTVEQLIQWKKENPFPPDPPNKPKPCHPGKNWSGIIWSTIAFTSSVGAYYYFNDATKDDINQYDSGAYFKAGSIEEAKSEREKIENSVFVNEALRGVSGTTAIVSLFFLIKYATKDYWY